MSPYYTIHDKVHVIVWAGTTIFGIIIMTTIGITAFNGTGFYTGHPDPKLGSILITLGVTFIPSFVTGYILACLMRRLSMWLVPLPMYNDLLLGNEWDY